MKKLFTFLMVTLLLSITANAQWQNTGAFPDSTVEINSLHGIAVDPDGKVWMSGYGFAEKIVKHEGDTVKVRAIYVFNADGTPASFSPITTITMGDGFTVDTLYNSTRGMEVNKKTGNIMYSSWGTLYLIDYKTGKGIKKVTPTIKDDGNEASLTKCTSDKAGNIYTAHVIPGDPLKIYDKDLNFIENAIDETKGYSRSFEVSDDGNTIYWAGYSLKNITIYNRADEFSAYDSVNVIDGPASEAFAWNPATGYLWFSGGSFNGNDGLPKPGTGFTRGTYYAYDTKSGAIMDSLKWNFVVPESGAERNRGIAFSPDGLTAYIGVFSTTTPVQKLVKAATGEVNLTLQVDMSVWESLGKFDPKKEVVRCAGSFQDWKPEEAPDMKDDDGDKIYTVTYKVKPNTEYAYKFLIGKAWGNNEDNDRKIKVGAADMTAETVYYKDQKPVVGPTKDLTVVYTVDMEYEIVSKRFDPAKDTVELRGEVFGWGPGKKMEASTINPNLYSYTATQKFAEGQDIPGYKFFYTPGVWESGNNRTHKVTKEEFNGGTIELTRKFNDANIEDLTTTETKIKFICKTAGAISSSNNQAFSVINTVHLTGATKPLQWPSAGWPSAEKDRMIPLYDDGTNGDDLAGDKIFTTILTFPKYSPLKVQYKYGINFGDADNNQGGNDNENGVAADHFIKFENNLASATVTNEFGKMGDHELTEKKFVGIENIENTNPTEFKLEQNYPNPFNPSTVIRYAIPEAGYVVLKVYNTLGQEITTLVDGYQNASTYEVSFDASQLSSGIYIYIIRSGKFNASKKMMLIK